MRTKLKKNLTLNKSTISNLNLKEMAEVVAGDGTGCGQTWDDNCTELFPTGFSGGTCALRDTRECF